MRRTVSFALALVFVTLSSAASHGATQEESCRKAVNKTVAKLYAETLKGTQTCLKTRIATSGSSTDCLDVAQYDPNGKIVALTSGLATTLGATGTCGALGTQFAPSCADAPAACVTACANCGTPAQVAACLSCRVVELTKGQVAGLYGSPPDLSALSAARTCQNALGAETGKYGKARMKEQQKCQAGVNANKSRAKCVSADQKGGIAKANDKADAKIVGKCLTSPGSDQVPTLDNAAACLSGGTTATASDCALTSADTTTDAIFRLLSQPASIKGFVMAIGPSGELVPLPGVRIEVVGGTLGTRTDRRGAYALAGVPSGNQLVAIDGQSVGPYPRVAMGVAIGMVGETNMGIFPMPEIDMANAVDVDAITTIGIDGARTLTAPVTLTNPTIPGFGLDLPSGTVLKFDVPNRAPLISVSLVPNNVMPFPSGVVAEQLFTLQPENTVITPAAFVTFPNYTGVPNGSSVDIYRPDFATNSFMLNGTGTVTTGGTLIESDAGVIGTFDWHFAAPPNPCLTDVIGRVVDLSTTPIPGATVLVLGATTISAADGTFTITGLPCTGTVVGSAVFLDPNNGLLVGTSPPVVVANNSVTDVGDIVIDPPTCGNGITFAPETCDDGNNVGGDGCSPTCLIEICGNAIVDPGEECDDTPGCTDFCTLCGDGLVRIPGEECDLGVMNGVAGSGCTAFCEVQICGNGIREPGEDCDDGMANGGDVCSTDCHLTTLPADSEFSAVRATQPCNAGGGPAANDSWGSVLSCSPPPLDSAFQFGPAGVGTFSASVSEADKEVLLHAQLVDVRTPGDTPVVDPAGWQLRGVVRLTLFGLGPDHTVVDLPVTGPATIPSDGVLTASVPVGSTAGIDFSAFNVHNAEIIDLAMIDPTGGVFATAGFVVSQSPALDVDRPAKAIGGLLGFPSAYVACSAPGNPPNATVDGIASCTPVKLPREQVMPLPSDWLFGPDTRMSWRAKASSSDIEFQGQGVGILDANGPANGQGTLRLTFRLTVRDGGNDETLTDTTADFPILVFGGRFKLKGARLSLYLQSQSLPPLPSAQGMLVRGQILDANGNVFATIGASDID